MKLRKIQTRRKRSRAFTLVELLVVIAIIGVLVGLLLPAVQAAREAARRMQCTNNLKQIGLALQNYHDTFQMFPPGNIADYDATDGQGGHIINAWARILPFIEQQAAYDLWDFDYGFDAAQNIPARRITVDGYFCPSKPRPSIMGTNDAYGDYAFSSGTGMVHTTDTRLWRGMFHTNTTIRFRDILDGTSHTIAAGDKRTAQTTLTSPLYRWGYHGLRTMNWPMNLDVTSNAAYTCYDANKNPISGSNAVWNDWWCNFGSEHPGGAAFLAMDGSVHFISENIDLTLYQHLGDKADQNVATFP
ncbi:MAG: DUF1559 domain-containing protein [Novipirellula sp. JB048]